MTTPLVTTPWAALSVPVMKDLLKTVKPALVSMKIIVSCIQLSALLFYVTKVKKAPFNCYSVHALSVNEALIDHRTSRAIVHVIVLRTLYVKCNNDVFFPHACRHQRVCVGYG